LVFLKCIFSLWFLFVIIGVVAFLTHSDSIKCNLRQENYRDYGDINVMLLGWIMDTRLNTIFKRDN